MTHAKGKGLHKLAFILLVIGGLNWLLLGVLSWDIGSLFGGQGAAISRIIYIVIGLSALYEIFTHKHNCSACMGSGGSSSPAAPSPGGGPSGGSA